MGDRFWCQCNIDDHLSVLLAEARNLKFVRGTISTSNRDRY